MDIAITGAGGFAGAHIAQYLQSKHLKVRRITRRETGDYQHLSADMPWLAGADALVHCAGVAHVHGAVDAKAIARIRQINTYAPVQLAERAAAYGVRRFIFISTAHIYGRSAVGEVNEEADPLPTNLYAACKVEAESLLTDLAEKNGMELVILRPPLIYGPGVKANFLAILKLVNLAVPLPFGCLHEKRSYVYIDNVADAVLTLLRSPHGWNDVYNIADDAPLSIAEMCQSIAAAMGRGIWMLPVPKPMLTAALAVLGKRHMIEALSKPLVLDTRSIKQTLQWQPPFSTQQGLEKTVHWFLNERV